MNATQDISTILASLDDHGDMAELPDGRTLRLILEPDDIDAFDNINGCDAYGRVAWPDKYRGDDYRTHDPRPTNMTGRAVKLRTMGGDAFWWEPYYEGGVFVPPSHAERQWMADLVTFGFRSVGLELLETVEDSRGGSHEVVVNTAYLGGIDTLDLYPEGFDGPYVRNGYLRELLTDLYAELAV